ncbi:MAG: thioredoxin family protein [Bacteroidota bacterium]
MKKINSLLMFFSLSLLVLFSLTSVKNNKIKDKLNFKLLNVDGKYVSLKEDPAIKGYVIIFTCNHCPYARLYTSRLNAINTYYKDKGVPLIAISSTDADTYEEDSYEKMKEKAFVEHYEFPYLYDKDQQVAKQYNAQKTPHAYVIWNEKGKWVIKYNGAIDDNATNEELVKVSFVKSAIDSLLVGKVVQIKETKSIGCQIHFTKK